MFSKKKTLVKIKLLAATIPLLGTTFAAHGTVTFQWLTVGNPGNAPDTAVMTKDPVTGGDSTTGYGSVGYTYQISKYDVTDTQYVAFLNTVDPTGANSLSTYSPSMTATAAPIAGTDYSGGINYTSSAANGAKYSVKPGYSNQPAVWISWTDAARFTNWYANGQGTGGTETGVYNIASAATTYSGMTITGGADTPPTRASGANVFLPSENEFYKAAYYDPTLNGGAGGYYQYGTQSNTAPTRSAAPGGTNSANYDFQDYGYPNPSTNYVTDVGAYTNSVSYYGLSDADGDVYNWTENFSPNPSGPGNLPVYRGGSWYYGSEYDGASFRDTYTYADSDSYAWFGFRLARLATVSVPSGTWNVDAAGNWSSAGNWSGSVPNATDAVANFGSAITAARTITVDAPQTVGTITFSGTNPYTIAGSNLLSMNVSTGQASVNVSAGSPTISAPLAFLANATITVTPSASTLTLSNLQTSSIALTTAGAGQVAVNNLRLASLNISSGIVSVLPGGTNASTSVLSGLTIAPGADLNLNNNSLIIHGSTLGAVNTLLVSGYSGGAWNGSGIISSMAGKITTLGVLLNNNGSGGAIYATFEGQPTALNDVLVKYTYYGDTNLNGTVDGSDYSRIDNGYLTHATGWFNGDFNYDGVVDGSDYTLIDNAFNTQGATISTEVANVTAEIAATPAAAVPEPVGLGLIGLGGLSLLGRRRCNQKQEPGNGSESNQIDRQHRCSINRACLISMEKVS
jgi:sulfatase modifying factor 1